MKYITILSMALAIAACSEESGGTTATTTGASTGSDSGSTGSSSSYPGCDYNETLSGYLCEVPYASFDVCCSNAPNAAKPWICWIDPEVLVPSACYSDGFDPAGGGDPPCSGAGCPEGEGGTCPGHASWSTEFVVWAVYETGNGGGETISPTGAHVPAVCSDDGIGLCLEYDSPSELEALEGDSFAAMKAKCDSLSPSEVKALGFVDYPSQGSSGYFVTGHICTTGDQLYSSGPMQNNDYGFGATETSVASCGSPVEYDSYCTASDCPVSGGGSTGGVDESGGGESTGEAATDCSSAVAANVSWAQTGTDRVAMEAYRTADIRGGLADDMAMMPSSMLMDCSIAKINSQGKIWNMGAESILLDLGLIEDDVIVEVCAGGECKAPSDTIGLLQLLAPAFEYNGSFSMEVKRGSITMLYVIDVI